MQLAWEKAFYLAGSTVIHIPSSRIQVFYPEEKTMSHITKGQRLCYGVICAAALLVAVLGFFAPKDLASAFTWMVLPPLHARFVGAIYLFGAVAMLGCLAARTQAEARWMVQMIGVWTGMLFIISILNLEAFDFRLLPVWIWFASYIIYPLIAIWMTWRGPKLQKGDPLPGPSLPAWSKAFLRIQGIVVSVLAILLFFFPNFMATIWPWKVTEVLAQMYAGPLLSYGLTSLLFSRQDKWLGIGAIVPGMFAFTAVTVIVSFMHINLFSFTELADLLWFGSFSIAAVILGVLTVRAMQVRA